MWNKSLPAPSVVCDQKLYYTGENGPCNWRQSSQYPYKHLNVGHFLHPQEWNKNTSLICIVQEVWPAQPFEWDWGLASGSVPLYSPAWSLGPFNWTSRLNWTCIQVEIFPCSTHFRLLHLTGTAQKILLKRENQYMDVTRILNFSKIGP